MSSEDSASDSGEDSGRKFVTRPLPWRSDVVKEYLTSLDRKADRRRTSRAREMMVERIVWEPSIRPPPESFPEWAVTE